MCRRASTERRTRKVDGARRFYSRIDVFIKNTENSRFATETKNL